MIGSALSGIAILAGAGGKGGKGEYKKIVDLWNKLETSNFDFNQLSFPELQMVQEMMPEVYNAVVPDEAKTVLEDPAVRSAQMEAMGLTGQMARGGLPLADRIAGERAQNQIAQEQRGRDMAVMRSLASRGGLGAGDEAQLRMAANASAGNLASDLGQGLQETALNRRLGAAQAYGGLGAQLRYGDFRSGAFNAEAINRFNEQAAAIKNEAARYAAGARERSQEYNVGTRQRLADTEALGRLNLQQQQQGRGDYLQGQQFNQQVTKLGGQTGALTQLGNYKDRDRAAKEAAIAGIGQGVDQTISSLYGGGAFGGGGGGGGAQGFQAQQQPQSNWSDYYKLRAYDMYR